MAFSNGSSGGFDSGLGSSQAPLAEINTTPLVDVMLVLLVIFIITAPLMQQASSVNLPQTGAHRLTVQAPPIRLEVQADGTLRLDGATLPTSELRSRLHTLAAASDQPGGPELHLLADQDARYAHVASVLGTAGEAGLSRIAFVSHPASPESAR